MSQPDHLQPYAFQPGNTLGGTQGNPWLRARKKDIVQSLMLEFDQPCHLPGWEHETQFTVMVRGLVRRAAEQDPDAQNLISKLCGWDRLDIHLHRGTDDLQSLSDDELLRRYQAATELLATYIKQPRPVVAISESENE